MDVQWNKAEKKFSTDIVGKLLYEVKYQSGPLKKTFIDSVSEKSNI